MVSCFLLIWLMSGWFLGSGPESSEQTLAGEYVAFSLLEAQRWAERGNQASAALANLGGITRLVGMVHDDETGDIVLIGKAVEGRPPANLDDLVVALRSRLVTATWPLVSIDPTVETAKTGLQAVRFDGGIKDTGFGKDFLDCDIILKKCSLELSEPVADMLSYKNLCERNIRQRLRERGTPVLNSEWLASTRADTTIAGFLQRPIQTQDSFQSRFWFRPLASAITEREGIFIIRELCLGVAREVTVSSQGHAVDYSREDVIDLAANDFSELFTEYFPRMASAYPGLQRQETLYAMVAAAEGIARLEGRPDLKHFLYDYKVSVVETETHYDLVELYGILGCSGGSDYLVKISGGIELRTLLTRLNEGDVGAMRHAVLGSRPSMSSLCWKVPLDGWHIPNHRYCANSSGTGNVAADLPSGAKEQKIGFSLHVEAFELAAGEDGDIPAAGVFVGFSSPPAVLSPVDGSFRISLYDRLPAKGGVHIAPQPSGQKDDLSELRKRILERKQREDSLSWPVENPNGE